jgi:hypothetical protein
MAVVGEPEMPKFSIGSIDPVLGPLLADLQLWHRAYQDVLIIVHSADYCQLRTTTHPVVCAF